MPKKRKTPLGSSNLMQLIESGTNIKGKAAYLKVVPEDSQDIYIPIVIKGFTVADKSCGLSISVEIVTGSSLVQELKVTPCSIFMTVEEIEHKKSRDAIITEVEKELREINRWGLKRRRIEELVSWIQEHDMTAQFEIELQELGVKATKLTDSDIASIGKDFFIQHYKLTEDEINAIYWRFT